MTNTKKITDHFDQHCTFEIESDSDQCAEIQLRDSEKSSLQTTKKYDRSPSFEIVIRGRRTSSERPLIGALGSGSRCCPGVTPDYSRTVFGIAGISVVRKLVFLTFDLYFSLLNSAQV